MIRRPSRTALHSALSALAGGFRGAAVQRQQKEQRDQLALENERSALNTALRLSESGAEVMPPRAPDAPPDMPGMPAPNTVSFGGQTLRLPSPAERERTRAKAAAEAAETAREAENLRAFGAAQIAVPELVPPTSEYSPTVEYGDLLGGRRTTQPAPRSMTPGQAIGEAEKERLGQAYISEFGDPNSKVFTENERNRFWRAFVMLQQNNSAGVSDTRLAYSAFQAIRAGTQQSATIDAAERAEAEARAGRFNRGETPPGATPVTPSTPAATTPAQTTPARPATPAATPARPAAPATAPAPTPAAAQDTMPRARWGPADYDAALDALGPEAESDEVNAWLVRNRPLTRVP